MLNDVLIGIIKYSLTSKFYCLLEYWINTNILKIVRRSSVIEIQMITTNVFRILTWTLVYQTWCLSLLLILKIYKVINKKIYQMI